MVWNISYKTIDFYFIGKIKYKYVNIMFVITLTFVKFIFQFKYFFGNKTFSESPSWDKLSLNV